MGDRAIIPARTWPLETILAIKENKVYAERVELFVGDSSNKLPQYSDDDDVDTVLYLKVE